MQKQGESALKNVKKDFSDAGHLIRDDYHKISKDFKSAYKAVSHPRKTVKNAWHKVKSWF